MRGRWSRVMASRILMLLYGAGVDLVRPLVSYGPRDFLSANALKTLASCRSAIQLL